MHRRLPWKIVALRIAAVAVMAVLVGLVVFGMARLPWQVDAITAGVAVLIWARIFERGERQTGS